MLYPLGIQQTICQNQDAPLSDPGSASSPWIIIMVQFLRIRTNFFKPFAKYFFNREAINKRFDAFAIDIIEDTKKVKQGWHS